MPPPNGCVRVAEFDEDTQRALQIIAAGSPADRRLCPSCGRRWIDTRDDRCRPCDDDARERELAAKREWWNRRGARQATKLERAKTWLSSQLRRGPVDSRVIRERADKAGIAPKTLRRARTELNVDIERRGAGADHRTYWSL